MTATRWRFTVAAGRRNRNEPCDTFHLCVTPTVRRNLKHAGQRCRCLALLAQVYAARPTEASRCFSFGNTSCFSSRNELCQASGLCL